MIKEPNVRFLRPIILRPIILLAVSLAAHLSSHVCQAQYTPVFSNTHVLSNGAVSIEVMDPTDPNRQNRAVRYSPMAFIIQANFNNTNYFYESPNLTSPWNSDPIKYAGGSPMEFDLGDFDVDPPGFSEATFGGSTNEFIKIGVGILGRTVSGDYRQSNDYQFIGANTQATWAADQATFTQTLPRESDTGYRYELETVMKVSGDELRLDYELTNNGSKSFQTAQYLHNFTTIGGNQPGPNSEIEVPWDFSTTGNASNVTRQDDTLVFRNSIAGRKFSIIPTGSLGNEPYEFTVRQTDINKHYVASLEMPAPAPGATATPLGMGVWNDSTGVQFSPEQFVLLSLDPGETIAWSRNYEFSFPCDADADGDCDNDDLIDLYAAAGTSGALDLDGSGTVDGGDVREWLNEASVSNNPAKSSTSHIYRVGDLDLNGRVNGVDLGLLLNNFGSSTSGVGYAGGDINMDMDVDSSDLGLLLNNFGLTSAAANAVPEPESPTLLIAVAIVLLINNRRRRSV